MVINALFLLLFFLSAFPYFQFRSVFLFCPFYQLFFLLLILLVILLLLKSFNCKHILLLQWDVSALWTSKCVTSELKSSHLKILTESKKVILSELITAYFFEHSQDYFCEHNIFCPFAIQMVMLVSLWGWCIKIGWLSVLVSLNHFHLIYYVDNTEIEF